MCEIGGVKWCVVQGKYVKAGSLLLTCGSWGLNQDHQAWQQMPLPTQPSPSHFNFMFNGGSCSYTCSVTSSIFCKN